jgi:hypothetical protein
VRDVLYAVGVPLLTLTDFVIVLAALRHYALRPGAPPWPVNLMLEESADLGPESLKVDQKGIVSLDAGQARKARRNRRRRERVCNCPLLIH